VDASWDRNIGYEKMAEFVKQANAKNVGVILWYNSNGLWNAAPMSPKNRMHEQAVRREEFAKLQKMGIKGVKIDFFGGDKQATMKLYLDILKDAADYGIMVNCHGATIPRGWQRTYPNLVSMEAVRGMEYCTFEQANADKESQHCTMLPFTRNVIGSMDYTPTVLDPKIRGVRLTTTPAFEIALPVIFESGIQHFGLVPDEMKLLSDEVKTYLQKVPVVWDETKLLDGCPGQCVIMARRSGDTWYIAGINGRNENKAVTVDLSFIGKGKGILITDGPNRTFTAKPIDTGKFEVELQARGGFVIIVK
jgi:alpha-glucosidase